MDNRTNLVIKSYDANDKTYTTSITYVNPQATNETLNQLAQKINAMQSTTIKQIYKETREVLI